MNAAAGDDVTAIRDRIDVERAQLSQTVEALANKVDVKARAHDKAEEIKGRVHDNVEAAKEKVREATVVARRPTVMWPAVGTLAAVTAIILIIKRLRGRA